jgi:hypothetical protein
MEYLGTALLLFYAGAQVAAVAYIYNMEPPLARKYSANNDMIVPKPRRERASAPAAGEFAKAA